MKKLSVKVKITIWYLLLMGLMAGLMLVFLLLISGSVYQQNAMDQLDQTLRSNLTQVSLTDGSLTLAEEFQFYQNGVYTLVYSQNEALLAGQVPVAFTAPATWLSSVSSNVIWSPGLNSETVCMAVGSTVNSYPSTVMRMGSLGLG